MQDAVKYFGKSMLCVTVRTCALCRENEGQSSGTQGSHRVLPYKVSFFFKFFLELCSNFLVLPY